MKRRREYTDKNIIPTIVLGMAFAVFLELMTCLVTSALIFNGKLYMRHTALIVALSCLITTTITAYIAGRNAGGRYAIACFGTAAGYLTFLALCTLLLFRGQFGGGILRLGVGMAGGVISCTLCMMQSSKIRHPKR